MMGSVCYHTCTTAHTSKVITLNKYKINYAASMHGSESLGDVIQMFSNKNSCIGAFIIIFLWATPMHSGSGLEELVTSYITTSKKQRLNNRSLLHR